MRFWRSANNIINVNFGLYSTFQDAILDENRWQFCNYDDIPRVGAFRDCGPTLETKRNGQWTSDVFGGGLWNGDSSKFYIYIGTGDDVS